MATPSISTAALQELEKYYRFNWQDADLIGHCYRFEAHSYNRPDIPRVALYVPQESLCESKPGITAITQQFGDLERHTSSYLEKPLRVESAGALSGYPVLVMVHAANRLDSYDTAEWSVEFKLNFVKQLLQGMKDLHDMGIIHGALRPGVVAVDENKHPLVSEFPLPSADETGVYFMDPRYSNGPISDEAPVDVQRDLFSVGMIAYRLLLGQEGFDKAFTGETSFGASEQKWRNWHASGREAPRLDTLMPGDVPVVVAEVLLRLLATKDRSAAYEDAQTALTSFSFALNPDTPLTDDRDDAKPAAVKKKKPVTPTEPVNTRRTIVFAGSAAVLLLAGGALWFQGQMDKKAQARMETACATTVNAFNEIQGLDGLDRSRAYQLGEDAKSDAIDASEAERWEAAHASCNAATDFYSYVAGELSAVTARDGADRLETLVAAWNPDRSVEQLASAGAAYQAGVAAFDDVAYDDAAVSFTNAAEALDGFLTDHIVSSVEAGRDATSDAILKARASDVSARAIAEVKQSVDNALEAVEAVSGDDLATRSGAALQAVAAMEAALASLDDATKRRQVEESRNQALARWERYEAGAVEGVDQTAEAIWLSAESYLERSDYPRATEAYQTLLSALDAVEARDRADGLHAMAQDWQVAPSDNAVKQFDKAYGEGKEVFFAEGYADAAGLFETAAQALEGRLNDLMADEAGSALAEAERARVVSVEAGVPAAMIGQALQLYEDGKHALDNPEAASEARSRQLQDGIANLRDAARMLTEATGRYELDLLIVEVEEAWATYTAFSNPVSPDLENAWNASQALVSQGDDTGARQALGELNGRLTSAVRDLFDASFSETRVAVETAINSGVIDPNSPVEQRYDALVSVLGGLDTASTVSLGQAINESRQLTLDANGLIDAAMVEGRDGYIAVRDQLTQEYGLTPADFAQAEKDFTNGQAAESGSDRVLAILYYNKAWNSLLAHQEELALVSSKCHVEGLPFEFVYVPGAGDRMNGDYALAEMAQEIGAKVAERDPDGDFCIMAEPVKASDFAAMELPRGAGEALHSVVDANADLGQADALGISYDDAHAFARYVSEETGKAVCLPTIEQISAAYDHLEGTDGEIVPGDPNLEWSDSRCTNSPDQVAVRKYLTYSVGPGNWEDSVCNRFRFQRQRDVTFRLVLDETCLR